MLKIETIEVMGLYGAIHGMRNPLNSWKRCDSGVVPAYAFDGELMENKVDIGPADLKLLKSLTKAGPSHRKVLRMVHVQANVVAPLYWWKEYDTYKVGTVAISSSTMHKVHSEAIKRSMFSFDEDLNDMHIDYKDPNSITWKDVTMSMVEVCETLRKSYLATKDKRYWRMLIQFMSIAWNQKRTIDLDYEVLISMYPLRKDHKQSEWHTFCDWIKELPYMKDILEALDD